MDVADQVLARAAADPGVRGVILTGSRARGMATARSDYDVTIVVADQAQPWRHSLRTGGLDEVVGTVAALADTSVHWRRYSYRGAKVLLDRMDGGVARLVHRQATYFALTTSTCAGNWRTSRFRATGTRRSCRTTSGTRHYASSPR